ncbi:MAG: cysteine dioxygenase family protein [Dehalococcoidales bacterium]|nr:cysteine dioxygenase family protein [Dehalococcoidales bacterium]
MTKITGITHLVQALGKAVEKEAAPSQLIEQVRPLLTEAARDTRWLEEFLEDRLYDDGFFSSQTDSIWSNEISLFRDPQKRFSLLAYVWKPHTIDTVHDHGSWGIIAALDKPFRERKFKRLDDGATEGYAELEETSSKIITTGQSTEVLPLNDGIHQILNPGEDYVITLNVYGRPLRSGYVQFFDAEKRTVWRAFPPRIRRQMLFIRALGNLAEPWAEKLLKDALDKDIPDLIKNECRNSLRHEVKDSSHHQ